jgi:ornithine cyclodeaminase/alanine dehydrogenase-like protein (mu-crystallin family)
LTIFSNFLYEIFLLIAVGDVQQFDGCVPNADIAITATTTASSLHVIGWALLNSEKEGL